MGGCFRWFLLWVLMVIPLAGLGQDATTGERTALALQAERLLDGNDPAAAWQALVRMDAEDGEAWRGESSLLTRTIQGLSAKLKTDFEADRMQEVVRVGELLRQAESARLVQKLLGPEAFQSYVESVRFYLGNSYWKLGSDAVTRNQTEQAEEHYRESLKYLRPGDQRYARANVGLAQLIWDRGGKLWEQGRSEEGKVFWREAIPYYLEARDQGQNDPQAQNVAALQLIYASTLGFFQDISGVPTPTPAPTPTPEPGFMDNIMNWTPISSIREFLGDTGSDGDMVGNLITWGIVAIVFILVYWVVPLIILSKLAQRDIKAHEWRQKVRYLGIIALVLCLAGNFSMPKLGKKEKTEKNSCAHCGFSLDNMFAYEDLVFSRCPSCKNKITPIFSLESYITFLANSMATEVEKVNIGVVSLDDYVKKDAMVRLVRATVTLGVRRRASDIHVEPDERGLVVRQRIDGIMTEMFCFPRSLSMAFVSAIKASANMNIAEKRVPQDGKFQMMIDKTNIDVRVASSPTSSGEKASLRVLDIRSIQMGTKHLGMSPEGQRSFDRAIHQPHGMVLITGPTGSGKTTTIYVALQQLTGGDKNIISIEDPIEFRIPGVNQMQVNPQAGLTFAGGLRSILRQDPDVIVVGEIRDKDTADISVNAVQTGHLVFSTLHTVDAASSVARLLDFGVSPRQFADALSLIVAQRLIRLVCQYCKESYSPEENVLIELGIAEKAAEFDFQRGVGCETCNNTGYYRRTGIFEMLVPSERMRVEMENASLSTGQIRELAVQSGMRTLRQDSLVLLKQGRTTAEETLRTTK